MADRIPRHRPRGNLPPPQRAPDARASASERGYDRVWQRLRLMILREEPLCRVCAGAASQVDHIVPLAVGGSNDRDNLQPLCHSCHSRKTALDAARARPKS